ncbi:hypothetical protein B4U80_08212 [Leptotrombidium deliense]|uniref:RRM domain-containing protein n=1 Tax=Leptotrombidium deliense TaxID=299467 RepID=A0A443SD37_9ACAR|nr:hypothetical protein B4U80_08212 [Leptotrombidium deliense]
MSQSTGRSAGPTTYGSGGGQKWGDTTSKKGEVSRIFVSNTDSKATTLEDLESKFSAYGKIEGIDINPNGFAFVQFFNVSDAQRAVQGENGTYVKGRRIEVRMFDKSGPQKRRNRERSRSPMRNAQSLASMPSSASSYGAPTAIQSGPPPQLTPGNDIEIIVVNKDQWAYAEMIEKRLRQESTIKYIDLLFLHSPQHLVMTLNDLFERRTLYAAVVTPINEEHKSLTLHILHNQMEHRNVPLENAIDLIKQDYETFMTRRGAPSSSGQLRSGVAANSSNLRPGILNGTASATYSTSVAAAVSSTSSEKRLPDEVAYLLRTTLSEGGVQFLSLPQIDSIIEYFSRERDRLTSQARQQQLRSQTEVLPQNFAIDHFQQQSQTTQQTAAASETASNFLDNPQVKAALNSLLQFGAISNTTVGSGQNNNLTGIPSNLVNPTFPGVKLEMSENIQSSLANAITSEAPSYMSTSASMNSGQAMISNAQSAYGNQHLRRHPLLGTELNSSSAQLNPYAGMSAISTRQSAPGNSNRGYSSGQRF